MLDAPRCPATIALLDADPDLADGIADDAVAMARRHARATVLELEEGRWDPPPDGAGGDGWLGLFVVEGLVVRSVTVGPRSACELLGPGDVIRPADADGQYVPLPIVVDWRVVRGSRLAVLDGAFARRVARWPTITGQIMARAAQRSRQQALANAVSHLAPAHLRMLAVFWLLGARWGRMGCDGVRIELPLTHQLLAVLAGVRRPTATIALQRLARGGLLERLRSDRWLLTHRAIEALAQPEQLDL